MPKLHHRADGDIKGTGGEFAELDSFLQDLECWIADLDGLFEGIFVDLAYFGVAFVITHQLVNFVDLCEGGFDALRSCLRIWCDDYDSGECTHDESMAAIGLGGAGRQK
ncbi:hypothetical protein ES703_96642 [subsurface metagenome]